jgi:hypothetical protein
VTVTHQPTPGARGRHLAILRPALALHSGEFLGTMSGQSVVTSSGHRLVVLASTAMTDQIPTTIAQEGGQ